MQIHCIRADIDIQVNIAGFDRRPDTTILWLWDFEALLSKPE